jgi:hypothetical protein
MAHSGVITFIDRLPPDLLAEIHGRLGFIDRLAFAAACGARSRRTLKPEAPCLVFPGVAPQRVTVFPLTDPLAAAGAAAADPAMRDYVVLGSSAGCLVTADARGALWMANPVTGEQSELPAITTIPFLRPLHHGGTFCLDLGRFAEARFGCQSQTADGNHGGAWWGGRATFTETAGDMRLWFYRKVVLSAGSPPTASLRSRSSYSAMLILSRKFGAPAFATAENPAWRLAPSRDGVEDAIHHNGSFYSLTYSGEVEAWERDGSGDFVSRVVAPRLAFEKTHLSRKYLAAAPDDERRLMAVLKYSEEEARGYSKVTRVSFKVQVLDEARGRWEETADIGDAALFVGMNGTLCVPAREYPGTRAGCVYFTEDDVGKAWLRHQRRCPYPYSNDREVEYEDVGVYSLHGGKVERIAALEEHPRWPPPAWFTPRA